MATITMTPEETDVYDNGSDEGQYKLMCALRDRARALNERVVEILTSDGFVADVVQ